jgi:fucose 4-O-acetylase-like acetyltransferase
MNQKEMQDITIAKGIAILLVVIGHILGRGTSEGNAWFDVVDGMIYLFHMPFFMAISGYLFFRIGRIESVYSAYRPFITKQFTRLILPFFGMGLLVLLGKMLMQHFVHVDNVPQSFITGVTGLFWDTGKSPSTFIWYIYVLFIYTALTPFLFHFTRHAFAIAIVLGLLMYCMPSIKYMYLDKLMPFYIFFIIGGLLRQYEDIFIKTIDRYAYAFITVFFLSLILLYDPKLPEYSHAKFICGMLSIPAVFSISRMVLKHCRVVKMAFSQLGNYSYVIYLFNTICIGLTKAVIFKFMGWNGSLFLIVAPILVTGGLLGPIIIHEVYTRIRGLLKAPVRE